MPQRPHAGLAREAAGRCPGWNGMEATHGASSLCLCFLQAHLYWPPWRSCPGPLAESRLGAPPYDRFNARSGKGARIQKGIKKPADPGRIPHPRKPARAEQPKKQRQKHEDEDAAFEKKGHKGIGPTGEVLRHRNYRLTSVALACCNLARIPNMCWLCK